MLTDAETTHKILGVCMEVFHELGSGFLEPVYQEALASALRDVGIPFKREHPLTIYFRGKPLQKQYIADFICCDRIILELKDKLAKSAAAAKAETAEYEVDPKIAFISDDKIQVKPITSENLNELSI